MTDLSHEMGGDLALSASGDLLAVDGAAMTRQRVLRRLLTNPGGYIWRLAYGAGLARFVGEPGPAALIATTIRRQMALERGVGAAPVPTVNVVADKVGTVQATVRYADAATGTTQVVTAGA